MPALVEATSDFVAIADVRGQLVYMNPAARRLVGLSVDADLSDLSYASLCPAWVYERTEREWLPAALRDGSVSGEGALLTLAGQEIPVWFTLHVHRDAAGEPEHISTIAVDITERKHAEQKLERSLAFLEESQRSGHIGSWEWDLASNAVTWSDELYRVYGLEPGTLPMTFERFVDFLPEHDRERVRAAIEQAYRERQSFSFEHQIVRPSGEIRTLQANGRVVVDAAGTPIRMVGSGQDVTARKLAEEALRDSEGRLRAVWESAADAMALSDPDGIVLAANPAYYRLMGYRPEQIVGQSFALIFPDVQRAQAAEQYRAVFAADERVSSFETIVRRADGTEIPVEARYDFVVQDGRRTAMVSMIRDITERRALERMQRDFISMVGHELRNPLAATRGFAQLMRRREAYSERAVKAIVDQTEQLDRLIGDLLLASSLEAGALTLRPERLDLVERAQACVEEARAASGRHAVRVEAPDGPVIGTWDPDRLSQVLRNLLGNALKYSPDGGEIVVRVEDRGTEAEVAVRDQGLGIESEALSKLFGRFYRAESVAQAVHGIGLGLYVTKELVEAHGGRIWAESGGPGQGSTFHFTLPFSTTDHPLPGTSTTANATP